ncbi:MAG: acetate kinase [Candidatus Korarchaeota archaeon]|nr:acetate kinase [Candidatus Korarchaeota archaeon]NIU82863.1 acetate/propionate family kinase [Candidatus Thorarchaeota archaeon]NIW12557.1 acetate/propionate family kinase [Candidatus Thorarchaeota archaeon]NIW50777.1 acetate/propionate family kinase [Candidatus Korarchaeota archaeon]
MRILVINSGSSSIKFQLFDMKHETPIAEGIVEKIGLDDSRLKYKAGNLEVSKQLPVNNHEQGIEVVLNALTSKQHGVITDPSEIEGVGHRVVHGGETIKSSVIITDQIEKQIKRCADIAPLHNPPNLAGIQACEHFLPHATHVAVLDTSFHTTLPKHAYIYGLPYEYYERYKIRKYGFHGTSHNYVAHQAAEMMDKPLSDLKVITCHLGNGCSLTAVDNGKSIETSMGFTPLEGLIMGTRCGDIDPAIVPFVMKEESLSPGEVDDLMNKESGLLGLSGVSNDMRDIVAAAENGNKRAELAIKAFSYRVKKYIGAYATVMNGLDVIVFTAGIGEHRWRVRERVCKDMDYLGIKLDSSKNKKVTGAEIHLTFISKEDSEVAVLVIPTNEELKIAKETQKLIEKGKS